MASSPAITHYSSGSSLSPQPLFCLPLDEASVQVWLTSLKQENPLTILPDACHKELPLSGECVVCRMVSVTEKTGAFVYTDAENYKMDGCYRVFMFKNE